MVFARAKWAARVHILLPCCHLSARFFQNGSDFLLALFFIPTSLRIAAWLSEEWGGRRAR